MKSAVVTAPPRPTCGAAHEYEEHCRFVDHPNPAGDCLRCRRDRAPDAPLVATCAVCGAEADGFYGTSLCAGHARLADASLPDADVGAVREERDQLRELARDLYRFALYGVGHRYEGECPHPDHAERRDPNCPACAVLVRAKALL